MYRSLLLNRHTHIPIFILITEKQYANEQNERNKMNKMEVLKQLFIITFDN